MPNAEQLPARDVAVLAALKLDGTRSRKVLCPAHSDRRPSLQVTIKADRVLLHCHAGCVFENILAALGVDHRPLAVAPAHDDSIVATYLYSSPDAEVLGQKIRRTGKRFSWRSADGTSRKPAGVTLYGVERLARCSGRVILVAGEKDADALTAAGELALSLPDGDSSWLSDWADMLAGRDVVLWPDADPSGWRFAARAATDLSGVAASVTVVEAWVGLNDAHDHLAAGHTVDDATLIDPIERLAALVPADRLLRALGTYWGWPSSQNAPTLRAMMKALIERADASGRVRIARSTWAADVARSVRSIERGRLVLLDLGLIVALEQGGWSKGGATSNLYQITDPETWAKSEEVSPLSVYMTEPRVRSEKSDSSSHPSVLAAEYRHDGARYGALNHRGAEVEVALLAGPQRVVDVARALDIDRGSARYHLLKLVASGVARKLDDGRYERVGDLDQAARYYKTVGRGTSQRRRLQRATRDRRARINAWRRARYETAPVASYEHIAGPEFEDQLEPECDPFAAPVLRVIQGGGCSAA